MTLPSVALGSSPRVALPFAVVAPQSFRDAPLPNSREHYVSKCFKSLLEICPIKVLIVLFINRHDYVIIWYIVEARSNT